ncbi:hypothetical protein [Polluticaenibacter yanchengensis]|uniref:Uncharacterized protein n=1 Tax=Polluticaenibacter yanchengensis TaxID=3014562 RepID=A0ABT4UP11_9BACT|nr:hypothetical protein [Chitinophagaceae bacterium LY-5]
MTFIIKRSWGVNYKNLVTRPRISHKVSEYVFDFVNENLLKPNNLLQSDKYVHVFTLSFSSSIPKNRKIPFPYISPFATKTRLFFGQKGFEIFEKTEKWATLSVLAHDIDQSIVPYEYATVVFNMFADFLLSNYKKLDKEDFDKLIIKLDKDHIEGFPFPASFDDQQYSLDNIEQPVIPLSAGYDWIDLDQWIKIDPKVEYLKHYPF